MWVWMSDEMLKTSPRPGPSPETGSSHLDDELGVGVGEALELVLVQVHDEELVRRRQLHRHLGELLVEVADVSAGFLPRQRKDRSREDELFRLYFCLWKRRRRVWTQAQRWRSEEEKRCV